MSHDLSPLGWNETLASAYRRFDRSDTAPARVLRAERGICTVLDGSEVSRAGLGGGVLLDVARDRANQPAAGDWVVLRRWPDRRVTVECVLPRRTALIRPAGRDDIACPVPAANVDTVAVVEPLRPAPDPARIERLLAVARASGAAPLLVLSKSDLSADPRAVARRLAEAAPGVPVVTVSATLGLGVEDLRRYATGGRTLALLGRSGAGRSTLVDALAGTPVLPVQPSRDAGGTGRNLTAYRNLVILPSGGSVIDIHEDDLLAAGDDARRGMRLLRAAGEPPRRT